MLLNFESSFLFSRQLLYIEIWKLCIIGIEKHDPTQQLQKVRKDIMTDQSLLYAKAHKKEFVDQVIDGKNIAEYKTAVFMAGSPGAGKTEVATTLAGLSENICMIDADEFRRRFPDYNGLNSSEFQKGSSWLVDHVFTFLLKKGYSFILDGTFAIGKAEQNIERALKRDYLVTIYYIYQDPYVAWEFTRKREKAEGRFVPKERFINAYFKSRENIIKVKGKFDDLVEVNVIFKDYQNDITEIIENVQELDLVLPRSYTKKELEVNLHD